MAQAGTADLPPPKERAVSSEPCTTRPNPFGDGEISSRKRRRTSLASDSRSLSVETADSSHTPPPPESRRHSAMDADSGPANSATPEPQQLDLEPTSEPRSSRVTINTRTPSRPLEAIRSTPPSPSNQNASPPPVSSPADAASTTVEELEAAAMLSNDAAGDSAASSSSDSGSPPIEVVSVGGDDDADFVDDEPIMMLDDAGRSLTYDPTISFPFHDITESYLETVIRLLQYFPTHDQVPRAFIEWIDKYLGYAKAASPRAIDDSYFMHRDVWQPVPQLVMHMVNRKLAYPRSKNMRQDIFAFYRSFAQLTAFFVELDLRTLRNQTMSEEDRIRGLASPHYVQALAALTRKEEAHLHTSVLRSGDDDWSYVAELVAILDTFQHFPSVQGGSLTNLRQLAQIERGFVSQFPRPVIEHLGNVCLLAGNILRYCLRRTLPPSQELGDHARRAIARTYPLFSAMAELLSDMIDRKLNQLSSEGTGNIIEGLAEVYQTCLATGSIVPEDVIDRHLQGHPPVAAHHVAEAVAYQWKFTHYVKLIRSGQMQLRVMAVSAMCGDLVNLYSQYRKNIDPHGDDAVPGIIRYVADFLLRTGLVSYILGPTCHPEITVETSNIIGFLVISNTYSRAHTDAMWQTVTSTQDPRVSDALIRMVARITHLMSPDLLLYFFEKLNTVPVEVFSASMRDFCEQVLKHILARCPESLVTDTAPFELFIRLIRQSSGFGSQSAVAHPDIQQFALQKLDNILTHGPGTEGRWMIYRDCLRDIARRTSSTIGSLWVLKFALPSYHIRDLHELASQHDLTRLLIEELEAAMPAAKSAGFPAVLSGSQNTPRRELLASLILHESQTITDELGPKLWSLLVGPAAACQEDRDVAWQILTGTMKRSQGENAFVSICFSDCLPTLDPKLFCQGTLDFVREGVMPLVNDPVSVVLDDDENPNHAGIEQLWRIVLTAPTGTVEQQAIRILVSDVYIESRSIQTFPHYRARKVHLALVNRCLRQLSASASRLKTFADGTPSSDDDSMVVVPTDQQVHEQELLFVRSLAVLRVFHQLHQAKPEFSAPDMRTFILESSEDVVGEPAELKYQSFDGERQTAVMPLNIGKRNTAASLLASLREATGFESYRIYYRGRPFVPRESDVCKSLEDLQIHNGIILVKKEAEAPPPSPRVRQGASPVEVEILSHFEELWEYLSLDGKLSREIYGFLVTLPADEKLLEAIDNRSLSYTDIFHAGQPLRSLYAVHALHEYLGSRRRRSLAGPGDNKGSGPDGFPDTRAASLVRVMSLIVPALCDSEFAGDFSSRELQIELGSALVDLLVFLLKQPELPLSAARFLDAPLLDRILALLSAVASAHASQRATKHVPLCLQSIFESCSKSDAFMSAFCTHPQVPGLLEDLLLNDPRPTVRQSTALLIREKTDLVKRGASVQESVLTKFRGFFWPLISQLVRPAITRGGNSAEVLDLCFGMLQSLRQAQSEIPNLKQLSDDWFDLLLGYTTFEDLTQPAKFDTVAAGLVRLLHDIVCGSRELASRDIIPKSGTARRIFWKHLFPGGEDMSRGIESSRPIGCSQTRGRLLDIIFILVKDDPTQFMWLLQDLNDLVPVSSDPDGDPYVYDLPQQFDRAKAIRAPCGYPGLRNLSNTCYFNSLLTQLFMNVEFREFMLAATVRERYYNQNLLFQTQKLFAYMQESIQPFINPEECVASIKTYEDTQIDPAIQMDVDEFYNLLFDRWEGLFASNEEKNRFRSFYGGQLVQQVRSQECEHVSERLEPFSAIQCDIKGKSSLQESLQAYVDGEIMEGDNKYKCSTCDRHVDAVKRACLKDPPDNLIFHLKRFDFNLRTMQRSKINDYFAFPTKIDMRPYTIDHLSNPSQDKSEDVFELVGVLIHTGTAESGHYISYVRVRPAPEGDAEPWVEFNDETVSPWDPESMASSCFGGPDYQTHFQSNNAVFDKQYSAYMLFYQRSSSLAKNHLMAQRSGSAIPLRVEIPKEMQEYIQEENAWLLRRHCIFEPSQIQFVCMTLGQLRQLTSGTCSNDHALETQALVMALSHLDQVASRTKDVPDFYNLASRIQVMCEACPRCSLAVYKYFHQYVFAFRMLLQRNVDEDVRQATAGLFIQVLQSIKAGAPVQYGVLPPDASDEEDFADDVDPQGTVVNGMMRILDQLWANFHISLRSWPEVFDFMLSFVSLGRHELAAFLGQPNFLKWLLWIVWADVNAEVFLSPQFAKLVAAVSRRMPNRPPSYEAIIALLDYVLANVQLTYTESGHPAGVSNARERVKLNPSLDRPFELTKVEADIIHQLGPRAIPVNVFVDRLISIAQNPSSTDSIIANLMRQSRRMELGVYQTLLHRITGQVSQTVVTPYLRVAAAVFCRLAADSALIGELIKHVSQQCLCLQNSEGKAFLDFMQQTIDGSRERSGETEQEIIMAGLDNVPNWAPGLLGYFDASVVDGTELFLQERIFQYRNFRPPAGDEAAETRELAEKMRQTARTLGFRCLEYLRDNFVVRNADVTERAIAGLKRVVVQCSRYFNLRDPAQDHEAQEFSQLSQGIMESLARLMVVDDLEEDASDWENSSVCSGQLEDLADNLGG